MERWIARFDPSRSLMNGLAEWFGRPRIGSKSTSGMPFCSFLCLMASCALGLARALDPVRLRVSIARKPRILNSSWVVWMECEWKE